MRYVVIITILILAISIYLNRSYANFYNIRDQVQTFQPTTTQYNIKATDEKSLITYAALGDSLTIGTGVKNNQDTYPYILAGHISKENKSVKVYNLGRSGDTTDDLLQNQIPQVLQIKPDLITIFIGTNDVHGHFSKTHFEKNYRQIIETLKPVNAKIYLINIPLLGSQSILTPPYDTILDERIKQFNQVIQNLSQEKSLPLIDLYTSTKEPLKDDSYYSSDLFHPSAKGYRLFGEIISANL